MRQDAVNRQHNIKQLEQYIAEAFGDDMAVALGLEYLADPDRAWAHFWYQGKLYRLSTRRDEYGRDWFLVRLDAREDDDHRQRPSDRFMQSDRNQQGNIDKLLLTLVELAAQLEAGPIVERIPDAPEPRVMNDYEASLLDALRLFLQHEL